MPSTTNNPLLKRAIERMRAWQGRQLHVSPLAGGLTNTNFRVNVDGQPFVVRVPGSSTELLSIDRHNEHHNTQVAAGLGIGPRVIEYFPDDHVMVLEFISGPTMSRQLLCRPNMPSRVAESLTCLHAGPRFLRDFNMLKLAAQYWQDISQRRIELFAGVAERREQMHDVERVLEDDALPAVACHNDLLPENFIDDGQSLRIVDYEYSGNNDPCFELGNLAQEMEYDAAQIQELCAAYFGQDRPRLVARVKLNMIVSDYVWTLWAAIQNRISTIDFDFWKYGQDRWNRAEAKLTSAELADWLNAARSASD